METFSTICLWALVLLCLYNLIRPLLNKDKRQIWSPMTFITLVYGYYVLVSVYMGKVDYYGLFVTDAADYAVIGGFISYLFVHIGFYMSNPKKSFDSYNYVFTSPDSTVRLAIILFFIGFVGYSIFRGFSFSVFAVGDQDWEKAGDFEFYFSNLISLCCASCCLLLAYKRKSWLLAFALTSTLILDILSGSRYRMVILLISFCTVWHLYPQVSKLRYHILIPLALSAYFFFAMMDSARQYGSGLNREAVETFDISQSEGASENYSVFSFSGYVMSSYAEREKVYFEPFWCAITLPLPRALFPWKPNADYVKRISTREFGGAAFTYYAEAFMAFGWIGLILYALFFGWVSKRVWSNYLANSDNINAILFLALFNGFTYIIISRGYMAQMLMIGIYFVYLPFWITRIIRRYATNL